MGRPGLKRTRLPTGDESSERMLRTRTEHEEGNVEDGRASEAVDDVFNGARGTPLVCCGPNVDTPGFAH